MNETSRNLFSKSAEAVRHSFGHRGFVVTSEAKCRDRCLWVINILKIISYLYQYVVETEYAEHNIFFRKVMTVKNI